MGQEEEELAMATEKPRILLDVLYYEAYQDYLKQLPYERFMEETPQGLQRKIFLESMDVVHEYRPDIQTFNELVVQYPAKGRKKPKQVVPDNMVVVYDQPIKALGSFDLPLQPAKPFWMLEYVSRSTKRKDYDDNMERYERELKTPYYLLFQPDVVELTLYKLSRGRYVSVKPNAAGRYPLPDLEMEVALLDEWVRFWFRGELVPLPGELLRQVDAVRSLWQQEKHRADEAEKRAQEAEQELVQLRALLDQRR
jgi:Uma2 family endonuclease